MKHKYQLLLLLLMLTSEIVLFSADPSGDDVPCSDDEANYWFSRLLGRATRCTDRLDLGNHNDIFDETLIDALHRQETVLSKAGPSSPVAEVKSSVVAVVANAARGVSKYQQTVHRLRLAIDKRFEIHKSSDLWYQKILLHEIRHGNNMLDFKAALQNVAHLKIYSPKGKSVLCLTLNKAPKYMQQLLASNKNVFLRDKNELLDIVHDRHRKFLLTNCKKAEYLKTIEQLLIDDCCERFKYETTRAENRLTRTVSASAEAAAVSSIVKRKPSAAASDSESCQVKHSRREKVDSGVDE